MTLNWKRIALLIGFFVAIAIFGYLLYFLFLRPALPTQPTPPDTNVNTGPGVLPPIGTNVNIPVGGNINGALPGGELPPASQPLPPTGEPTGPAASEIASGGLTQSNALTTADAYGAALSSDGNGIVYYDRTSGQFYQIGADGKPSPFSNKIFYEVEKVTWSASQTQAILEYPDGSNISYNFQTGRQVTLPQHWKDFSFSANSQQLIFKSMGDSEETRWLAVANPDGSQAKKLEHLGNKDASVYPSWSPNNQVVAMYTEDKDFDRQNLFFLGLNGENFKSTIIEGRGLQTKWSTKGDKLLYSVHSSTSDYKPTLWIVEAQGDNIGSNRQSLRVETWADKCTFANNLTIYCAVPTSLQNMAGLFPDQFDVAPSEIYKIDLGTGFRSKIASPTGNVNIENIFASADGNYLYFTSKTDGRLYNIRLQ